MTLHGKSGGPHSSPAWPDALDQERIIGTNKRYAEQIDARRQERIDEIIMRDHTPQSLTNLELELDTLPLTRTPKPIKAMAWVHYDRMALHLRVEVVAWTPRACAIRWTTPQGREDKVWVWASAVDGERT